MRSDDVSKLVNGTPFIEPHEHLLEESTRLKRLENFHPFCTSSDFSILFSHYGEDDLRSTGMSTEERRRFF